MRAVLGFVVLLGWSVAWLGAIYKLGMVLGATPKEVKWLVCAGLVAGAGGVLILMTMRED